MFGEIRVYLDILNRLTQLSWFGGWLLLLWLLLRRLAGVQLGARPRMVIWWSLLLFLCLLPGLLNPVWRMNGPLPWQWRIQVPNTPVLLPQYRLELMPETVSLPGDEIGYTGQVLGCIWKRSGGFPDWVDVTPWFWALLGLWAGGALLSLLWHLGSYVVLRRRLRTLPDCREPEIQALLTEERAYLNISLPIPVKLLPSPLPGIGVNGPCVVGFVRPVLMLVHSQWETLTEPQREAVMAHELWHVRRGDNWVNLLLLLFQDVLWFHPIVHWALRKLRQDLEYLRDFQILEALGSTEKAREYAAAILQTAKGAAPHYRRSLHSGMLSASGLGFRLELMAEREKRTWSAVAIVSVFLLFACFISAVSGIYLQPFAILY